MPAESTGQLTKSITTTNGNVVVSSSPGRFSALLVVNAATTGVITVWDNATTNSGTMIGYFASGTSLGAFQAYDIPVVNGIVVNNNNTNDKLTVVYSVS